MVSTKTEMAPKLYTCPSSCSCNAVSITAKALGIVLDEQIIDFTKNEHLSPEFVKLNPQHSVPTLDDSGKIICDSHAINCYLVGKYGKDDSLYPKDLYKRALVDQRLAFDLGTLSPILRTVNLGYVNGEIRNIPPKMVEQIKEAYSFLEKFLEEQWIAGDNLTIADFSCATTVTYLDCHVHVDPKMYPKTAAWVRRMEGHPCFAPNHEGLRMFKKILQSLRLGL